MRKVISKIMLSIIFMLCSLIFVEYGNNKELYTKYVLEDNISYLNKDRWDYPIEDLLQFTRKTSQYLDEEKFRFWLWEPANINGRIARQDSIFVFGLEKFFVSDHYVDIIAIPPQWKKDIVNTLKTYLGITSETVFPDVDGYAVAHSKTSKLDNVSNYLNITALSDSWKSQNFNYYCPIKI